MEYECGPVLLYSQDKIRMMDFLSDVFEFEVDSISEIVQRGPLFLKLFDLDAVGGGAKALPPSQNKAVIFSFKVKREQELKEIMSKYNFFLYRKSAALSPLEKLDLIQDDQRKVLTISDIDQRLWRFEYDMHNHLD